MLTLSLIQTIYILQENVCFSFPFNRERTKLNLTPETFEDQKESFQKAIPALKRQRPLSVKITLLSFSTQLGDFLNCGL